MTAQSVPTPDGLVKVNEYGTPVTEMSCTACGHVFTVCPAVDPTEWGTTCLGDNCSSYDIARDIDMFFEPAVEAGLIRRVANGCPPWCDFKRTGRHVH